MVFVAFFVFLDTKPFQTSMHVKGLSQKLWPCYSIHWTQAAASLQPLSMNVQLVTPKPAFEKALHHFIPQSECLHSMCPCAGTSSMLVQRQLLALMN